jgi:transketolase C-terminal domain/subunit
MIAVNDRFGQSGNSRELYKEYGLDYTSIVDRVKEFIHKY